MIEYIAGIVAIASVSVNIVLVAAVIHQNRRLTQQYEIINRPWLVLTHGKDIGDFVGWYLENTGNLQAEEITITTKHDHDGKKPDKEERPTNIGVIMPKQNHGFTLDYLERDVARDIKEIDIEFIIKYKFLNHEKKSKFYYLGVAMAKIDKVTCVEAD